MSWSIQVAGKGEALAAVVRERFEAAEKNCSSIPEEQETVRRCKELALTAVEQNPSGIRIEAWGCASQAINVDARELRSNTFKIEVQFFEVIA